MNEFENEQGLPVQPVVPAQQPIEPTQAAANFDAALKEIVEENRRSAPPAAPPVWPQTANQAYPPAPTYPPIPPSYQPPLPMQGYTPAQPMVVPTQGYAPPVYQPPVYQSPVYQSPQPQQGAAQPMVAPVQGYAAPLYPPVAYPVPNNALPKDYLPTDPPSLYSGTSDLPATDNKAPTEQGTSPQPPSNDTAAFGTASPVMAVPPSPYASPSVPAGRVDGGGNEAGNRAGMRVFCVLLALVVVAGIMLSGGYFLGRSGVKNGGYAPAGTAADLQPRPEEPGKSIAEVAEMVRPSVVGIVIYSAGDSTARGEASGIIMTQDGYILTNDHIYKDIPAPKFLIITSDGKEYDAEFYAGDLRSDIAVLKAKATGLKAATFGDSSGLVIGESVLAIGNPAGAYNSSTVTQGIVSAVRRQTSGESSYSMRLIQTNAAINPGNSGGPLVNLHGQVIGVSSSKIVGTGYEGMGFAIPSVTAKSISDSLLKNKFVENRARMGIRYVMLDTVTAKKAGLPAGMQIAEIDRESDLTGKDVKAGDIITHVDGKAITGGDMVLDIIESSKPGQSLQMTIYRPDGKRSFEVSAKLLEDKGSNSYSNTVPDSSGGSNKEFDFPFGD